MTRRLSSAQAVREIGRPIFTTKEIADFSGGSLSVTSRVLARMERQRLITRVIKGLWCVPSDPRFTAYALVHFLSGTRRAYVSFVSALHLHGLIEQIPQIVYAATTGHTRLVRTPVGAFSFHRIAPSMFAGFEWYGDRRDFLIAAPEKALVDSLYLSSRRGRRFRFLPELDTSANFRFRRTEEWARRIPDVPVRTYVLKKLGEIKSRRSRAIRR